MKKLLYLILVCTMFLTGCFSSSRIFKNDYENNDSTFVQRDVGAEVLIFLNDEEEYLGELLTVNDSIMFMCNEFGLSEEELSNSSQSINAFQNRDIKSIWILGKDNHLIGLAIGIGVSIPLINAAGPKEGESFGNPELAGLGLLSIVAGFLAGAASSTYDEEIYNYAKPEDFDFVQLNIYSRYGGLEPEYIQKIK